MENSGFFPPSCPVLQSFAAGVALLCAEVIFLLYVCYLLPWGIVNFHRSERSEMQSWMAPRGAK